MRKTSVSNTKIIIYVIIVLIILAINVFAFTIAMQNNLITTPANDNISGTSPSANDSSIFGIIEVILVIAIIMGIILLTLPWW